jgi:hypothetical protein
MGLKRMDQLRRDAVGDALSSWLRRTQADDNFGVGMATLNKWMTAQLLSGKGPRTRMFRCTGVEEHREAFSAARLCQFMDVSLRPLRSLPASRMRQSDMVTVAHLKETSCLGFASRSGRGNFDRLLRWIA